MSMNLRKHYATLLALGVVCGWVTDTSVSTLAGDNCCTHGNLCHKCDIPVCYPSGPPFGYNQTIWNRWPIQVIEEHVVTPDVEGPREPVPVPPLSVPTPAPAAESSPPPTTPAAIESPSNEGPIQEEPSEPATPPVPGVREEPQGNYSRQPSPLTARPANRETARREALAAREALLNELNATERSAAHAEVAPIADAEPVVTEPTTEATTPKSRARTASVDPVVVPVAEGASQKTADHKVVRQRFFIFAKTRPSSPDEKKQVKSISGLGFLVAKLTGGVKKSQPDDERIQLLGRAEGSGPDTNGGVKQTAGSVELGSILKPISSSKRAR